MRFCVASRAMVLISRLAHCALRSALDDQGREKRPAVDLRSHSGVFVFLWRHAEARLRTTTRGQCLTNI